MKTVLILAALVALAIGDTLPTKQHVKTKSGEIPSFSWYSPIRVGYYPFLSTWKYTFAQRSNDHLVHSEKNYIEEDFTKTHKRSYDITARRVLGAAPKPFDKYIFFPSVLDFYQTSLRDPVFYQLQNKIFDYIVQFKNYIKRYNHEDLHFDKVKLNGVKIDKLVTYFDIYDVEPINAGFFNRKDLKSHPKNFKFRQPRLNHKSFTITYDVTSDVATDATFKLFIGPKYDSNGYPISLDDNWMNFVELDWFTHKLVIGENTIARNSEDFWNFREDSLPISEIWKLLDEGKVPKNISEEYYSMPNRLMLPKGSKAGYPCQIFAFVYPHSGVDRKVVDKLGKLIMLRDNRSFGFPLDHPVDPQYFEQPNMFFEDVLIYHEGEMHNYKLANPELHYKYGTEYHS